MTAQTKTLSIERLFSIRYPDRYSPAAAPPAATPSSTANARPSAIHTPDSIAAARTEIACAWRWTTSRSPTSSTVIPPTSAHHAHQGTARSTKRAAAPSAGAVTSPTRDGRVGWGTSGLRFDHSGSTEGLPRPVWGHDHRVRKDRDDDDRARGYSPFDESRVPHARTGVRARASTGVTGG